MDRWAKILKVCSQNGFFDAVTADNIPTSILYGPLGSLLRRNIKREWLFSVVNISDAKLFPLEVLVKSKLLQQHPISDRSASLLLPDVLENYFKFLPSYSPHDSPCGFATYGSHVGTEQSIVCRDELFSSSIFRKLGSRHWLCVAFFCSPKTSSDWFNDWSRYRYRWWRKFSSMPSKFSMSEVTETATGDQQLSLMMNFPWGKEKIECVTLYEDAFFNKMCRSLNLKNESGKFSPAIIVCQSELDIATFAYLANSFAEKWRSNEIRQLFQLNIKLSPYKVAVSLNGDESDMKKIRDLANHLEKDLKKSEIVVLPLSCTSKDISSQFKRFDEMGVPFTVVLDRKAFQCGVASVRNRDSTLEEHVHIGELKPKLLRYLQMQSLTNHPFTL